MKNIYTKCPMCGKETVFMVTDEQYQKYIDGKENVQRIFPELSCEEREMLITGICPDCWNKIFPKNDEEE